MDIENANIRFKEAARGGRSEIVNKGRFENDELEYDNGLTNGENFHRMLCIAKRLTEELLGQRQEIEQLRAELADVLATIRLLRTNWYGLTESEREAAEAAEEEMSSTQCPKCGADYAPNGFYQGIDFKCGSSYTGDGTIRQSTTCLLAEQRAKIERLTADLSDVTEMLRAEHARENPGLPIPDFVMMARAEREAAAEATGGKL